MQIDRTNRRILAILERDARRSAAAIGREIGLSRQAVQDRLTWLQESGILLGARAEIAPEAGLMRAVLFVRIAQRPCDDALSWLAGLEGVTRVLSLAGDLDALVLVCVPGTEVLSALNDTVAASPLIASATSQVVLRG